MLDGSICLFDSIALTPIWLPLLYIHSYFFDIFHVYKIHLHVIMLRLLASEGLSIMIYAYIFRLGERIVEVELSISLCVSESYLVHV